MLVKLLLLFGSVTALPAVTSSHACDISSESWGLPELLEEQERATENSSRAQIVICLHLLSPALFWEP